MGVLIKKKSLNSFTSEVKIYNIVSGEQNGKD